MASNKSTEKEFSEVEESESTETELLQAIERLKQELNLASSNTCLLKAAYSNGLSPQHSSDQNESDYVYQTITELEESVDCLCIQEAAISYSLENQTLQTLCSLEALDSELHEMLREYIGNETQLTKLSIDTSKEYLELNKAKKKCFECLQEYTANEREQNRRLQEDSRIDIDDTAARDRNRKLKEIRFMQLIIPRIISQIDVDFREQEWLAKLCRKIRDPILSVDDLL